MPYNKTLKEADQNWWTGPKPNGPIKSLPQLRLDQSSRQKFQDYFDNSWLLTEVLFSGLQSEKGYYIPPYHQLRHPLIFYFGHPAVLYVNKLRVAGLIDKPVDEYFETLFAVGVDEMSWDDMSKNEMKWPAVEVVTEYRRRVYKIVTDIIQNHPALENLTEPVTQNSQAWALALAFEHERIHFETSSVLMRELSLENLVKPQWWPERFVAAAPAGQRPVTNSWLSFSSKEVSIGKHENEPTFGWDNEYGKRVTIVRRFETTRYLITNGEFHEFVAAGGYREEKYWSFEGWRWRQFRNSKWPVFWVPDGPEGTLKFKLRNIFDVSDFDLSLPAVVNYHEAQAFCAFKTKKDGSSTPYRLLTEAEHHRLREGVNLATSSWNSNLAYGGECPVNVHTAQVAGVVDAASEDVSATRDGVNQGDTSPALGDIFGNVWQWCEDEFYPLPGFRVHPYYEDFSTPCFDSKHQMIMGGSFASTGDEARPYARFQFRPHFFQHAGFRMVKSGDGTAQSDAIKLSDAKSSSSNYENLELLNQYMLLHFGTAKDVWPFSFGPQEALFFPQRCAAIVINEAKKLGVPMNKALDLGCAVGGSTFELARAFKEVVGVDLSTSFIAAADELRTRGKLSYYRKDEGHLGTFLQGEVAPEINRQLTTFRVGDACALPHDLQNFDAVLMANLLCRLPDPKACLSQMTGAKSILKRGGLLVILSPYSWLEAHTRVENWLGGLEKNAKPLRANDTLRSLLEADFKFIAESEEPLVIREHARKYQYIVSHLMVWQKK